MKLHCISPEGVQYSDAIQKVTFPSVDGTRTILLGHFHSIIAMGSGTIHIRPEDQHHHSTLDEFHTSIIHIPVYQGLCTVADDGITMTIER